MLKVDKCHQQIQLSIDIRTHLVLLLQVLHSSEGGTQILAGSKWLLLSHPQHFILYVSQKLLEQHGIFQIFTTYVDGLMKGVVPEGEYVE